MTKSTEIPIRVKKRVWFRDDNGLCILCGRPGLPNAHFISRAQGGKGIEQNIVTLCIECHRRYDGEDRQMLRPMIANYLRRHYKKWNEKDLIYRKWTEPTETNGSGSGEKTD